jgi:predicted Zn-dependent peptidase
MGHVDSKAFAVMTALLGQGMSSRLFITLREELGAGYYVNASYNASNDTADITISTGTEPKRISEVIKAIKLEIDRLTNELVPEPELQKTKNYLIGNMYMGLESSDSVAFHVAHYAILHELLKTPADLEKEIKSIKSKDILHVAKKYFKPDQFHIAIIGPHTESEIKKVI